MKLNKKVTRAVADFFKDKKVHFVDQTGKELDLAPVAEYFADKTAEATCVEQVKEGFNIVVVIPPKDYNGKDSYQRSNSKCLIQHIFQDNCLKKNGQIMGKSDMTPEIRTLISGVIFMTKYTKEIKLAIYHEWVDDHRRGTYLS
ncbi:hypothetical protein LOB63_06425, partial [Lactobacillus delbrueckii subsp. lactis]|nr:hypothetical protein [Lactobacillus delbrueckii subsp. lactis]